MTAGGHAIESVADAIRARAGSDSLAVVSEDVRLTHREAVREASRRASLLLEHTDGRPVHVGVLLDNVAEAVHWLEAAALTGSTVVGLNSTHRGAELARDIEVTDCEVVVTDTAGRQLLEGLEVTAPVWLVDGDEYREAIARHRDAAVPELGVDPSRPYLLIFTSGTTSAPKAAICSQRRLADMAFAVARSRDVGAGDVVYNAMPWFHSNAMFLAFAPYAVLGTTLALRPRFSASAWIDDVRRFEATYFNYVGKALEYLLATPPGDRDRDHRLRFGQGNEANEQDLARFAERFGVPIHDGYGSTEMGVAITRTPDTPTGSLGRAADASTVVVDPATGDERPPADFDADGALVNAEHAIGEIVNHGGLAGFEGYYNNAEAVAARSRNGWYWSGDLGYRDRAGFFYFAGRADDWLRVDGENFAAGPLERVMLRHPEVMLASVYAVADERVGDQVMAALVLRPGSSFDPDGFGAFLDGQRDLGPKWRPMFVRVASALPMTHTNKVLRRELRVEGISTSDPVWWAPARGDRYRRLSEGDRVGLLERRARAGGRPLAPLQGAAPTPAQTSVTPPSTTRSDPVT